MTAFRYLGLDLGTHTGWALAEGDRYLGSGIQDFSAKRNSHPGHRLVLFSNFLRSLGRIDEIYYERIMGGGGGFHSSDGHELYHQLLGVVYMHTCAFSIPTIPVWPGTLKKAFAGHGGAKKAEMCAKAHSLGWKGGRIGTEEGHDEVDALALLITQLKDRYNFTLKL